MTLRPRRDERTFYDRHALRYDRRWRDYQRATHEMLLTHLPGTFRRVVDVGCGTGTLLRTLQTRYPDAEGIGIDASGAMLRVARRKLADLGTQLHDGEACRLPLGNHSVDLLTLASVLHYLRRPSRALVEARRVLQPGGTVGIVDYVLRAGTDSLLDGLIRLYDPGHVRCRGIEELSRITTLAGFTLTHTQLFPIDHLLGGVLILARAPVYITSSTAS